MHLTSAASQFGASAGVGVLAALCAGVGYAVLMALIATGGAYAGLGAFCLFPVMVWIASWASGIVLSVLSDRKHTAVKSLLGAPALYIVLTAVVGSTVYDASDLRRADFWAVVLLVFIPSWPLTFWGLRRHRKLRDSAEDSVCAKCNYNLTGNVSGICPECGTPIQEDVKDGSEAKADEASP